MSVMIKDLFDRDPMIHFHCVLMQYIEKLVIQTNLCLCMMRRKHTGFIIQYLKPEHVITRNFHVFLHENSVKVINSLYTFIYIIYIYIHVLTFCNHHYKEKVVKLISRQ